MVKAYRNNGYREVISAHPSCTSCMGFADVYNIIPAIVTKLIQKPETLPKDLSADELCLYDTCASMDINEMCISS